MSKTFGVVQRTGYAVYSNTFLGDESSTEREFYFDSFAEGQSAAIAGARLL